MGNQRSNINKGSRLQIINSFMLTILLTANFISMIFASLGIINEGLVPILFGLSLIVSYITFIFSGQIKFSISKLGIILIYIIFLAFMLSLFFQGIDSFVNEYFIEFLGFGLIIYLMTLLPFSSFHILYFTMLIGNLILINPLGFQEYIRLETLYARVEMGATYAIMPSVVATIIFLFFVKKNKWNLVNILSYLSNGYLLYILVTEGTRGATLSIVLLFFFVIYIKISTRVKKGESYFYPLLFIISGVVSIIGIFNVEKILLSLNDFFKEIGIESATLIKTAILINNSGLVGVLNNRDQVYRNAFDLFEKSPIWGHGIGSYADIYQGTYPHNLFLQLLVEGGILLTIPFAIVLVLSLWVLIKPWTKQQDDHRYLLLLLFITCVPKLMLSSYLWKEQTFWLMIFVLLIHHVKKPKPTVNVKRFNYHYNDNYTY